MNARELSGRLAFTLIELIMIIVIVAMLLLLLLSGLPRAKEQARRKQCVTNLKQVGLSFRQWTLDGGDRYPAMVLGRQGGALEASTNGGMFWNFMVMSNELHDPKILVCPADDRIPPKNFGNGWGNSNVSYFVGLDALDTWPQMLLSGDRNITNGPLAPGRILLLTTNTAIGWSHALHNQFGNAALADGSVQGFNTPGLRNALRNMCGDGTNRLAIP